jgi:hypothetical protein
MRLETLSQLPNVMKNTEQAKQENNHGCGNFCAMACYRRRAPVSLATMTFTCVFIIELRTKRIGSTAKRLTSRTKLLSNNWTRNRGIGSRCFLISHRIYQFVMFNRLRKYFHYIYKCTITFY